ncbi:hypothetical protein ZIOFF_036895 [Zingiber officinale]|uniref:Uncharacterized protein n=1 Tax=Zingiber officinale TaxID=94328 RepID=A0A8J5GCJ5_ZINOF|nr:hypothetical protein ZIOFF_036895 [Zingiber officinale]
MEQITSRQQGLEEQIAEIFRTVKDARRRPLRTADSPTSAEYSPSRGSEGTRMEAVLPSRWGVVVHELGWDHNQAQHQQWRPSFGEDQDPGHQQEDSTCFIF